MAKKTATRLGSAYKLSDPIMTAVPGKTEAEYEAIEDYMRNVIFHSTLDWQTRAQLMRAARTANRELNSPLYKGLEEINQIEDEGERRAALQRLMNSL